MDLEIHMTNLFSNNTFNCLMIKNNIIIQNYLYEYQNYKY